MMVQMTIFLNSEVAAAGPDGAAPTQNRRQSVTFSSGIRRSGPGRAAPPGLRLLIRTRYEGLPTL